MMTHSVMPLTFSGFVDNEQPLELTYKSQQVLLLRRMVSGSIADLTLAEARTLIADNAPEEEF